MLAEDTEDDAEYLFAPKSVVKSDGIDTLEKEKEEQSKRTFPSESLVKRHDMIENIVNLALVQANTSDDNDMIETDTYDQYGNRVATTSTTATTTRNLRKPKVTSRVPSINSSSMKIVQYHSLIPAQKSNQFRLLPDHVKGLFKGMSTEWSFLLRDMSNIAVMDAPSTPYLNTYLDIDDLLTRFFWLITVDLGRFSLACIYLNGAEDTSCVALVSGWHLDILMKNLNLLPQIYHDLSSSCSCGHGSSGQQRQQLKQLQQRQLADLESFVFLTHEREIIKSKSRNHLFSFSFSLPKRKFKFKRHFYRTHTTRRD